MLQLTPAENNYIFDTIDQVIDSIKEHFPDLANDPESIQSEWIAQLESARDTLPLYDSTDARNLRDEDESQTEDYYNGRS